jgi:hypothetical protein
VSRRHLCVAKQTTTQIMKKNVGSLDGMIRIILAGLALSLILTQTVTGTWAVVLGVFAVIFVVTSLIGSCPLYLPFGISTRKQTRKAQ